MTVDSFFAYARERHSTHLRRAAGLPRSEWTQDPILRQYRFCNVYRELDRTTQWFRTNVRDPLRDTPEVLLATVLFRWFNRIETGEAIFSRVRPDTDPPNATAWDELLGSGSTTPLRETIIASCGEGPYVTGSYIIKTPNGMSKLDGVLWCVEQFMRSNVPWWDGRLGQREFADLCLYSRANPEEGLIRLQDLWEWLCQFPFMGPFMAYEVVTDLRHTALLDRAPDIMTWANPGPGAFRGLNRIAGRDLRASVPRELAIKEMRALLEYSRHPRYWPQFKRIRHDMVDASYPSRELMYQMAHIDREGEDHWPAWEMREVEHTLCEFDKYERARLDEGRPRQVFR